MTRALHELATGHVGAAFGYNALFPLYLGAGVLAWVVWLRHERGRPPLAWVRRLRAVPTLLTAVAVLTAFTVLRNIADLSFLAP
jgi:hypothetical protein